MLLPPALARKPAARTHAPSQPLMRSLLSQSQAPTGTSQALSVFSGLVAVRISSATLITQPTLETWLRTPSPLSAVDDLRVASASYCVNCEYCGNCGKHGAHLKNWDTSKKCEPRLVQGTGKLRAAEANSSKTFSHFQSFAFLPLAYRIPQELWT